jgi:hypothetical protein
MKELMPKFRRKEVLSDTVLISMYCLSIIEHLQRYLNFGYIMYATAQPLVSEMPSNIAESSFRPPGPSPPAHPTLVSPPTSPFSPRHGPWNLPAAMLVSKTDKTSSGLLTFFILHNMYCSSSYQHDIRNILYSMYCTRWTQENEQKPRQDSGSQDTLTGRSPHIQAAGHTAVRMK